MAVSHVKDLESQLKLLRTASATKTQVEELEHAFEEQKVQFCQ